MEISEIRVLMKYEFLRRATTRQAVANINSVFIIQVATNVTVARWFKKFRSRDFDLSNESHGRPKTQVDSDVLKATVEANSSQSARELSLMTNPSVPPSEYPLEVLEPWGLTELTTGKLNPWEPQTEEERLAAEKALHNNKIGGDMKIKSKKLLGNSVSDKSLYWENKTVPYVIDNSILSNKLTCLQFVKRKNEKDYIKFENKTNDPGCWSWVGRIGGAQTVNIGEGCQYIGSIVHEIGHAIGFWHEHQRQDRNKYVIIYEKNVTSGLLDNFDKTEPQDEILYNIFDYNSIMIYGNYAFSKRLWESKTLESTDKRQLTEPWSKPGVDNSDIERVKCMYCKKCKPYKP
ncbi:astacin [Nephila pilipes]|uniref:Metalloendopeptidase n=1 Tax=Nephila pilipes TaxID=299642 RepID=A0A8X6T4L0_NEPPI|nr:astacin [Nephila pilipes]